MRPDRAGYPPFHPGEIRRGGLTPVTKVPKTCSSCTVALVMPIAPHSTVRNSACRAVTRSADDTMSKRNRRPSVPTTTTTVDTIHAADVATVPPATVATVPAYDADAAVRALYDAAGSVAPATIPPAFATMVGIIRAVVATVPASIPDRRYDRIVTALSSAMDAAGFPTVDASTPINTTRFAGMGITDAQNTVYIACAASGVFVSGDVVACVWRAIAPRAKCDYIGRAIPRGYAASTLSMFVRGDHGTAPWFPNAVTDDVIRPWYVAGGVTHAPKPTA